MTWLPSWPWQETLAEWLVAGVTGGCGLAIVPGQMWAVCLGWCGILMGKVVVGESSLPSPLNRILGFTISHPGVLLTHAG